MISSKSNYALKAMIYIAINNDKIVKIKDISKNEDIPAKYLEQVISLLTKSGLLKSFRGNNGGYQLTKRIEDYNVYEIITSVDGSIDVNYDQKNLLKFWDEYNSFVKDKLSNITLSNLVDDYSNYYINNYYI
ncbi:MAG: Rrf2 family transcriptional regulator [Acholeplasmatales bacterium]|nr:Rrf2 family transcriptional regulator [Acholeplasmatales bacterium]